MPIIDKLSNLGEGRKLKNLQELSRLVNTFEPEVEDLTDDELRGKTAEFRQRVDNGEDARRSASRRRSRSPARAPAARSASATSTSS